MSHYIKTLQADQKQHEQREARENPSKHSDDMQAARERMTPLVDRLHILLATIPAEVQSGGLSLSVLQPRLRGRRGRGCSTGELGTALRGLGWRQERCWRKSADGFRSLWYPPARL